MDNPFYGQPNLAGVIAQPQLSRAQLLRPYPQYDTIHPLFSQGPTSDCTALQTTFSRRFSKGVAFEGSYTWAKVLDTGTSYQNSYDVLGSRSISSISSVDYRHRLVFSGLYELPVGRGRRLASNLSRPLEADIGGWQINGILTTQSGDPLGISATGTAALFSEASRANTNGGNPNLSGDAHARLDRWFDTSVFSQPAPYTLGNLSPLVTNLRNHYTNNLDLSLFKQYQATEKLKVQFRAEAFNSLNRVRFGSPNTNVNGGANFGRVTTQSNSPRQLQFGLKLIF